VRRFSLQWIFARKDKFFTDLWSEQSSIQGEALCLAPPFAL